MPSYENIIIESTEVTSQPRTFVLRPINEWTWQPIDAHSFQSLDDYAIWGNASPNTPEDSIWEGIW